jgi:hypothetical protein
LTQARLRLGHGAAGLTIVKHDERIAGADRLSFHNGDVGDDACDLAPNIDAEGSLDMPARHDALHEICAHHRVGVHRRPE